MKRVFLLLMLMLCLGLIAGCLAAPLRFKLAWSSGATGVRTTRGVDIWMEREVHYNIEPVDGSAPSCIKYAAQTPTGEEREPTSGVAWTLDNPDIGVLEAKDGWVSRRWFAPLAPGEGTVTAAYVGSEYPAQSDSCRVVVFPAVKFKSPQGVDVDGDGVLDVMQDGIGSTTFLFPGGVQHYLPFPFSEGFIPDANALGDMPADIAFPADSPTTFITDGCRIVIFKASGGGLYAAQLRYGSDFSVLGWRKLRDVA